MLAPSGGWLHMKPASIWQVDEQPSPSTLLPSSQTSGGTSTPSPQLETQAPLALVQLGSLWQSAEQPS